MFTFNKIKVTESEPRTEAEYKVEFTATRAELEGVLNGLLWVMVLEPRTPLESRALLSRLRGDLSDFLAL